MHSRKDAKTQRRGGKNNEQWNNDHISDYKFQIDKVDAQEKNAKTLVQREWNLKDTKTQKRKKRTYT